MSSSGFKLDTSKRTRIYLIRHGVVAPESRDCFNGRTEAALDPEGLAQIGRVAEYLKSAPPDHIYASPLQRCRDSAGVLSRAFGKEIEIEEGLREMDFGEADGMHFKEVRTRFAQETAAWYADLADYRLPGAETMSEVQQRAWGAVSRIVERRQGRTVAVQAHGGVNRLILARVLGVPVGKVLNLAQDYACLNILEFWPDRTIVKGLNIQVEETLPASPFDAS